MFSFFQRGPAFGIEIMAQHVRTALAFPGGVDKNPIVGSADLPAGAAADTYSCANLDGAAISRGLLESLSSANGRKGGRTGLCLPDAVFRIQSLDFDELPSRASDQERLIRWRLEKTAAFDLADTVLQLQVLRRSPGVTVLACIAKRTLIEQYEAVLGRLGFEVWRITPSSFAVANFYAKALERRSGTYALTHISGDSLATLVMEEGGVGFYRFREIKRSAAGEISGRVARDISDSLHFYAHRDRTRQPDLRHLYLSGDNGLCEALVGELGSEPSLEVHLLSPGTVLTGASAGQEFSAALGAGYTL
jgi:Tfp pilus assembly PilM family ATPase